MGRPELASHSIYGDQNVRLEHRHDVNEIVRDWCGSLTREEVLQQARELLSRTEPDRLRNLLWDIRTSHLVNKDMTETLH